MLGRAADRRLLRAVADWRSAVVLAPTGQASIALAAGCYGVTWSLRPRERTTFRTVANSGLPLEESAL